MTADSVPVSFNESSCEEELRVSLLSAFAAVDDPRKPRGRRFPLPALLSLIVIALLAGCKNPTQIYNFAKAHRSLLPRLGFRPPVKPRLEESRGRVRAPNEDTITYVLGRLSPDQFVAAFALWINGLISSGQRAAAVDGKALRGTEEHVLTVFVGKLRLAVWQKQVDKKENEFSALREALGELFEDYPGLWLLTGDAMFCQKEVAKKVVEARRHYLLQMKSPHKTDMEIAQRVFARLTSRPPAASSEAEKRGARKGR